MHPASRLQDRTRRSIGQIELAIPIKGVGLEQPGISGQMRLRMLAFAVAGIVEHRRRRRGSAERPIITDIDPTSPGVGLAFGQHWHRRVIAVQAFRRHNMRLKASQHRIEHRAARSHGVSHGRQADRHAFQSVALGLTVQRLMLAELFEQDHCQQAGSSPSPGNHMERGRCLADLLAIPAGKFLPCPFRSPNFVARDRLEGPGHVFAQLAQPRAATAATNRRRIDHHALAREVFREAISFGPFAGEAHYRGGLGDRDFRGEFIFEVALASSSSTCIASWSMSRSERSERGHLVGDPQLLMGDQGQVFGRAGALPPVPRHQHRVVRPRPAASHARSSAPLSASMSVGGSRSSAIHDRGSRIAFGR